MVSARDIGFLICTIVLVTWTGSAWAQGVSACGDVWRTAGGYGPFDYTNPIHVAEHLGIVEKHHFTTDVETLAQGVKGVIWGDIGYTLRAFPNHHRALYAAVRLWLSPDAPPLGPDVLPTDCYLQRAVTFKPRDGVVHMIYGIFLHRQEKLAEALEEYQRAVKLMPDSAEAHYNLGLLHADMLEYQDAKKHAERAYELGYPLPGLMEKLRSAGVWN